MEDYTILRGTLLKHVMDYRIFEMYHLDGYEIKEIASQFNVSERTVFRKLSCIQKTLTNILEPSLFF